ncbi:MAG: ATP-dependent DNA helicase [Patescibacteria group bacterium]|jgi:exodeoxyribonuclease-5
MISLTQDQNKALQKLFEWVKAPVKQHVSLGGYAGTGKTTLLGVLRQKLYDNYPKLRVSFCAFTGKASQVLQQSLSSQKALFKNDKVGTIHSLIYEVKVDEKGQMLGWVRRTHVPFDLIIVDEASMVSKALWQDLLSFHLPIIAVGDHGQLSPISDNFSLMKTPDITLEQIHRQAAGSPIIQLSQHVRKTGKIPVGVYGKKVVKHHRTDTDIGNIMQTLLESWNEDSLFLVGINTMRIRLNQQIRAQRGYYSLHPQEGDRVICLKNNWQSGIYNGMLGVINSICPEYDSSKNPHWYLAEIAMDDGLVYSGKISTYQFDSPSTLTEVKGLGYKDIGDLFDFGYAITVHKAQGSQARRVVVFEQRNRHMGDEEWKRWLYTAVTRAEEELVIIGD